MSNRNYNLRYIVIIANSIMIPYILHTAGTTEVKVQVETVQEKAPLDSTDITLNLYIATRSF